MQSYFNSVAALSVRVQHGDEIEAIRADARELKDELTRLQIYVEQRTAERWYRGDQIEYQQAVKARIDGIEDRVENLER